MFRTRLAAFALAGCMLTTVGCQSSGSSGGGLFSGDGICGGCCGRGSSGGGGLFSRFGGSGSATPVSTPVIAGSFGGGLDCPCSTTGGGEGMFHPAVMSPSVTQGIPAGAIPANQFPAGAIVGDQSAAAHVPTQPAPVTTPAFPPSYIPQQVPNIPPGTQTPPRIQPVPMAPSGVAPSSGMAPAAPWGPQ